MFAGAAYSLMLFLRVSERFACYNNFRLIGYE